MFFTSVFVFYLYFVFCLHVTLYRTSYFICGYIVFLSKMATKLRSECVELIQGFAEIHKGIIGINYTIIKRYYGCRVHLSVKPFGTHDKVLRLSFRISNENDYLYMKSFLDIFNSTDFHSYRSGSTSSTASTLCLSD